MSILRHTSGPWIWAPHKEQDNSRKGFIVLDNRYLNAKNIATVIACVGMYDEEVLANAKLIAAAPDLLEALRAARALLQAQGISRESRIGGEQFTWIDNAIKKATE